RTASLGDVKVLGRYQGLLPAGNLSLQWGLKLPTGSYTDQGQSTDPTAPGAVDIDRGLQPGTGTIDVILGASYVDTLAPGWSYMVQGLWQTAMHSTQGYRPGNAFNGNLGLRYTAWASWQPQLQLNARYALRDSGPQADAVSTGGTLVYLSPGINVPLTDRLAAYAYAQLPIYQDVHGVQLTPKSSASVGVRMAF
ncbi:MAG TPA: TonB-dependent receptor, partial [Aquabacterium sp.]|nr:TonB-dependent receptor [Aquabacterium sp.]